MVLADCMNKYLPAIFNEKVYRHFPIDQYTYSGFSTISNRNHEDNISQELMVQGDGGFVVWNWLKKDLGENDSVYVNMRRPKPLSVAFISSVVPIFGDSVRDHIQETRVQESIEFIRAIPLYKKVIISSSGYCMPQCKKPHPMGYIRPFISRFELGRKLGVDEHYTINFFNESEFRSEDFPFDFFCFGTKFAFSDSLASSLKLKFQKLEFDPILLK